MTEEKKCLILTSLFAGLMIGVGCMVYLACENKALGAFLFSAGLFFVLTFGGTLFTGICGLKTPWKRLAAVFVLNGAGILLAGLLTWPGGARPDARAAGAQGPVSSCMLRAGKARGRNLFANEARRR